MKSKTEKPAVAFQAHRNGKRLCTAGLNGAAGSVTVFANLRESGDGCPPVTLDVGGCDLETGTFLQWETRTLKAGDVVEIHVVEAAKVTRPRSSKRIEPDFVEKQEKQSMRRMAKKFGYRLLKANQ